MVRKLTSLSGIDAVDPVAMIESRIQVLLSIYRRRQEKLSGLLLRADLTSFQRFRAEEILRQVRDEVRFLDRQAAAFSQQAAPRAYRLGLQVASKSAAEAGIVREVNFGNRINTRAINVLADQMTQDLVSANRSIQNNIHRFIRQTQQQILEDSQISRTIAEGIIEGQTRRTVSDQLARQFREQMGEQQFVTAGGRSFTPEDYSELVARTRTREAASQGTVNGALQYGMDLVQIDVHGDACPLCRTRMGRVYSISGEHPDFPKLDVKPPYHPRCECNLFAVNETVLKRRGQYDGLVELSAGPRFSKAKDASEWLKENPDRNIATLRDLQSYLKARKAAA